LQWGIDISCFQELLTIKSANPSCGNGLLATAVICPKCGSPSPTPGGENKRHAKSKTVAVWLSVLFSYWAWLYTFNVNAKKFVVGITVGPSAQFLLIVGQVLL
jgi:hypothetical protein